MSVTTASPSEHERQLLVPRGVAKSLPTMVNAELAKLSASEQEAFLEEYRRKSRGVFGAYLCSLLYCHYAYLGRWSSTLFMWFIAIVTLGVGGLIWWIIDLFRMPGLVNDYNRDVGLEVLRNFKAINA